MRKIKVGLLGATGMVGQTYLDLLKDHPFFELTFVAGSNRFVGQHLSSALENKTHRKYSNLPPLQMHSVDAIDLAQKNCEIVFSALPSKIAFSIEPLYAKAGLVVMSNASSHRMDPLVPILIPDCNFEHLSVLDLQQKVYGYEKGFIITKSNCSIASSLIPLYPLHQKFTLSKVLVTTFQSVSGAGYPGVSSLDIVDNILPFIEGEEEKSESESQKILGSVSKQGILLEESIAFSSHCNRVPTLRGHLACVSVEFKAKPTPEEILDTWKSYCPETQKLKLPSAPSQLFLYSKEPSYPQSRKDLPALNGMSIAIGRLRPCPTLHYRFTALSDNLIRGAAGSGLLSAEYLYQKELLPSQRKKVLKRSSL